MAQIMGTFIQEFHVSPWVLPNESVMGWLKWSRETPASEILVTVPTDMMFDSFFNMKEILKTETNQIRIDVNNLESPGFFGFSAHCMNIPAYEIEMEITARLIGVHGEIDHATRKVSIVRPMILMTGTEEIKIHSEDSKPNITLKLINTSSAEALDLKPKIKVESSSRGIIEVITENASTVLERAPIRLLSVAKYVTGIKIRKQGRAKILLSFEYKDRVGNTYETKTNEIEILIETRNIKEIPITNICQGDGEPVEIPLAPLAA